VYFHVPKCTFHPDLILHQKWNYMDPCLNLLIICLCNLLFIEYLYLSIKYQLNIFIHELNIFIHELNIFIHELNIFIHELNIFIHQLNIFIHQLNIFIHQLNIFIHQLNIFIHEFPIIDEIFLYPMNVLSMKCMKLLDILHKESVTVYMDKVNKICVHIVIKKYKNFTYLFHHQSSR